MAKTDGEMHLNETAVAVFVSMRQALINNRRLSKKDAI